MQLKVCTSSEPSQKNQQESRTVVVHKHQDQIDKGRRARGFGGRRGRPRRFALAVRGTFDLVPDTIDEPSEWDEMIEGVQVRGFEGSSARRSSGSTNRSVRS